MLAIQIGLFVFNFVLYGNAAVASNANFVFGLAFCSLCFVLTLILLIVCAVGAFCFSRNSTQKTRNLCCVQYCTIVVVAITSVPAIQMGVALVNAAAYVVGAILILLAVALAVGTIFFS
jgi:hypothetical protein